MNFDDEFLEKSINTAPGIWGREVNWPDDMNKKSCCLQWTNIYSE